MNNFAEFISRAQRAQAAIDALGAGQVMHDCAAVERDNLDLHQALAEGIRRLCAARKVVLPSANTDLLQLLDYEDLAAVLDRTSKRQGATR